MLSPASGNRDAKIQPRNKLSTCFLFFLFLFLKVLEVILIILTTNLGLRQHLASRQQGQKFQSPNRPIFLSLFMVSPLWKFRIPSVSQLTTDVN